MIETNPYPRPTAETVCSWGGYLYFVHERENMRLLKVSGHAGSLTADPVLQEYRFTNVRRRDDRMSQWMIKHLIEPHETRMDLWFTLLIARLINWPPTLQALLDCCVIPCKPEEFNARRFVEVIEDCKSDGKVFGSAYMLYPTQKDPGSKKSESVAKYIIGDAVSKASYINDELWDSEYGVEKAVNALSKCYGISTFMAGQVVADLSYSTKHLGNAPDLTSYAPLGPGSQLGLNLLFGHKKHHSWSQFDFNLALTLANAKLRDELDLRDLTLHDVQNTMCEFSKYAKAMLQLARPRRLYSPETAY